MSPARGPERPAASDPLAALRRFEQEQLAARDFASARPWSERSGADPTLVHALPDGRYVGALAGEGAFVVLDAAGQRLQTVPTSTRVRGWDWTADGHVYAVSEGEGDVLHLRVDEGGSLVALAPIAAPGVAFRDVAIAGDRLLLADRYRGRVVALARAGGPHEVLGSCPGAIAVAAHEDVVAGLCLLSHSVELWGEGGARATIERDGPMWSLALRGDGSGDGDGDGDEILIATGGVEDHPLDRRDGAFGYIDSFVYLDRLRRDDFTVRHEHALNVSERGVVTPKLVRWRADGSLRVVGYGAAGALDVTPRGAEVDVRFVDAPPGITSWSGALAADPLLDGWVVFRGASWTLQPAAREPDPRPAEVRLGEALAFTTLMAPANASTGRRSRFTCETCHFEGTVDGRTHYTGRADVSATTKTLRGLFGNRPHFSRALDRTSAQMVHNEFRVAGKGSALDPWFTLDPADHPWLVGVVGRTPWDPVALRRALLAFLIEFTPEPNPGPFSDARFERGARLFSRHCEPCHQARLRADAPRSRLPPEAWRDNLERHGTLVWAREERYKTGVEPYVHVDGARVPSLRRLWVKRPYFTNGSAPTLDDVLARVDTEPFSHDRAGVAPTRPLTADERAALRGFLELL